jgi:hypothetical protein
MKKPGKVIMLPTDTTNYGYELVLETNCFNEKTLRYCNDPWIPNSEKRQHMYILSADEIKEGDWVLCLDEIDHPSECVFQHTNGSTCTACKKIIATTDSSLFLIIKNVGIREQDSMEVSLPSISQSFIDKYVREYNKGNIITDVMIEYEDKGYQKLMNPEEPLPTKQHHYWIENIIPKVNSKNNTIIIRTLVKNKRYTLNTLKRAFNEGRLYEAGELELNTAGREGTVFDVWFEDKLNKK